jgi:signal transduction histidine kinase
MIMREPGNRVVQLYAEALREYLAGAGEAALQRAYELGRQAIADGIGVVDLVALHHEALKEIQGTLPSGDQGLRTLEAAGTFLGECLSSFEMTHRGYREAVTALRRLNELLEEEARRIAHSLHDEAGQLLASVHLAIESVGRDLPAGARGRLKDVRALLDEIEKHLRRLSHELRPTILDDLGLLPALEFLAQGVTSRTGIPIIVDGQRERRLPRTVETALYRIVQEALTNATRHARARRIEVRLGIEPQAVRCAVRDDGKGIDPASTRDGSAEGGLGLIGIRERLSALGGHLAIQSTPGHGTELSVTIPLETHYADPDSSR